MSHYFHSISYFQKFEYETVKTTFFLEQKDKYFKIENKWKYRGAFIIKSEK